MVDERKDSRSRSAANAFLLEVSTTESDPQVAAPVGCHSASAIIPGEPTGTQPRTRVLTMFVILTFVTTLATLPSDGAVPSWEL